MKQSTLLMVVVGVVILIAGGAFLLMNAQTPASVDTNTPVTTQTTDETVSEPMDNNTIVDVAAGNPDFSTLVTAIKAADLVDTLSGDGPFTVFAPTNAAFEKLPEGTLDELLNDKEKLTQILTYHVVAGRVMAADVVKLSTAQTVEGSEVSIDVDGNTVMVNDATVTATDIEASNGVIHVIDTVLLPQ